MDGRTTHGQSPPQMNSPHFEVAHTKTLPELASPLKDCLLAQITAYESLTAQAEHAITLLQSGTECQPEIDAINQGITSIEALEPQMQRARQQWEADMLAGQVSDALRNDVAQLKHRLAATIETLLKQTSEIENKLRSSMQGLAPKLSQQAAASRMHRAYGQQKQ